MISNKDLYFVPSTCWKHAKNHECQCKCNNPPPQTEEQLIKVIQENWLKKIERHEREHYEICLGWHMTKQQDGSWKRRHWNILLSPGAKEPFKVYHNGPATHTACSCRDPEMCAQIHTNKLDTYV